MLRSAETCRDSIQTWEDEEKRRSTCSWKADKNMDPYENEIYKFLLVE